MACTRRARTLFLTQIMRLSPYVTTLHAMWGFSQFCMDFNDDTRARSSISGYERETFQKVTSSFELKGEA